MSVATKRLSWAYSARMERDAHWFAQRDENRQRWMLGDPGALAFLEALGEFVEMWDDLVDQDKPVTPERANEALTRFLLDVTCSPWFAAHREYLVPYLVQMVSSYLDSEELCTDVDERSRMLAFHLRNSPLELYQACAMCVGGWQHLREVGPEMRRFFATERFEDWEHANG